MEVKEYFGFFKSRLGHKEMDFSSVDSDKVVGFTLNIPKKLADDVDCVYIQFAIMYTDTQQQGMPRKVRVFNFR